MGKFFTDLASLEREIQNTLPQLLINEKGIADVLKKTMNNAVNEVVYKHYLPTQYQRRKNDGGLSDIRLMQFTDAFMQGNEFYMIFENLARGVDTLKGEYISETIENGLEENWAMPNGAWSDKRPFVYQTAQNIMANPSHLIDAIKKAFIKAGFEVR